MTNSVTDSIEKYRSAQAHPFLATGAGGIAVGALDESEPMTSKPEAVKLLWGHGQEPPDSLAPQLSPNARASSPTPRRISFTSKAANPSCSPSLVCVPWL